MIEPAVRLGAVFKCAPIEDDFEYRFMFDLTANTFLKKLVPKRIMDRKLNFRAGESFRTLAVLSYASKVLDPSDQLLDNIAVLERELKKLHRKSTLSLDLVVTEIALHISEHPVSETEAQTRFAPLQRPPCRCDATGLDPYYEACGAMLLDQLEMKELASQISSKGDYLATVFADAVRVRLRKGALEVESHLKAGRSYDASLTALRHAAESTTLADLEQFFQT